MRDFILQKYIKILGLLHRQNKKVKVTTTYLSLDTLLLAHFSEMQETGAGISEYGEFHAKNTGYLLPLACENSILLEKLRKEEADRNLSNQEKLDNIKYGRRGYVLSIIAIIISLSAIATEIILRRCLKV